MLSVGDLVLSVRDLVLSVGDLVLSVGGLALSVGGVFSMSQASAVFVFLCCIRVFGAFGACGAEGAAANKGVTSLRAFGAPP